MQSAPSVAHDCVPLNALAEHVLDGGSLERVQAAAILSAPDADLPELLHAAFRIRERYWGRRVKICMLRNARSGLCAEDCHYCSQSAVSDAAVARYRLDSVPELLAGARRAVASGARRYCMATSGRGPSAADVARFTAAARAIKAEHPNLELCVSLGLMGEEAAHQLKAAGVGWVNHNLNTSRRFHPNICTTHSYDDRIATVRAVRRAGLSICCGGIIGMGETQEDVLDLAFALRDLSSASPIPRARSVSPAGASSISAGSSPWRCIRRTRFSSKGISPRPVRPPPRPDAW